MRNLVGFGKSDHHLFVAFFTILISHYFVNAVETDKLKIMGAKVDKMLDEARENQVTELS